MTSSVLPVCLLMCVVGQAVAQCNNINCPNFTEDAKNGFSVRQYTSDTQWVGTKLVKQGGWGWIWWLMTVDQNRLFMELFRYIGGQNVEGKKIAMTAPVLMKFETFEDGRHEMSMFFYVDPKDGKAPSPNNGDLFFMTLPAGTKFDVKTFNSWIYTNPMSYGANEMRLKSTLTSQGLTFNPRVKYYLGYDQPWTWPWHKRTNEVMLEPMDRDS